jgi:hypothetical protein
MGMWAIVARKGSYSLQKHALHKKRYGSACVTQRRTKIILVHGAACIRILSRNIRIHEVHIHTNIQSSRHTEISETYFDVFHPAVCKLSQ